MSEPAAVGAAARAALAQLSEDFFGVLHGVDPLNATQLGVSGFDGLLPDLSQAGAEAHVAALRAVEDRLAAIDRTQLDTAEATNASVLGALAGAARADLQHGLWAANASAHGYVNPQAMVFQAIPTAVLGDRTGVDQYLSRLDGLGAFFDAVGERYREATAAGRTSPAVGVRGAIAQLEGHLASDPARHRLQPPTLPDGIDEASLRESVARLVVDVVRPGMMRLRDTLRDSCCRAPAVTMRSGSATSPAGRRLRRRGGAADHDDADAGGDPRDRAVGPGRAGRRVVPARRAGAGRVRSVRDPGGGCERTQRCASTAPRRLSPPSPMRWRAPRRPATGGFPHSRSRSA